MPCCAVLGPTNTGSVPRFRKDCRIWFYSLGSDFSDPISSPATLWFHALQEVALPTQWVLAFGE
jgi:hypothetical protein